MQSKFSRKIKYISFFLAMSVIYIHTYNANVYMLDEATGLSAKVLYYFEYYLNRFQGDICVPFFFVISGYLFFHNYSWNKVGEKYKSRFFSLFVPYILWCTIYFLLYLGMTNIPIISRYMNMEKVPFSFTYYVECLWSSTYTVLWYVKYLMFAILGTPLFYLIFSKKKNMYLNILSGLFFIAIIMWCYLNGGYINGRFPVLNIYFLIGGYIGVHGKLIVENPPPQLKYIGIIGLIIAIIFSAIVPTGLIWKICTIFCIWFATDIFELEKEPRWWQQETFFLYCAHSFLLELLEKLWLVFFGKQVWAAWLDYLFMPFVVLFITSLMIHFLKRYINPLYLVLVGKRKIVN